MPVKPAAGSLRHRATGGMTVREMARALVGKRFTWREQEGTVWRPLHDGTVTRAGISPTGMCMWMEMVEASNGEKSHCSVAGGVIEPLLRDGEVLEDDSRGTSHYTLRGAAPGSGPR